MKIEPLKISLSIPKEEIEEAFDIGEFLVDQSVEMPAPIHILSYVDDSGKLIPIITEDNISMIKGQAKSRKSTLIKAIASTILSQRPYKYGSLLTSDYYRNNLAIVDTEQGNYHCWRAARSISSLAERKVTYYSVVGVSAEKKRILVEKHLQGDRGCGVMILDNIVHFLKDFNSAEESSNLVEWLLFVKNEYNCHIIVVLHENGSAVGGGKAKGHLGSLLENTCETVIRVEKDSSDSMTSIVYPALTRNREFGKFTIEMDDHWIPSLRRYDDTEGALDKKNLQNFRNKPF